MTGTGATTIEKARQAPGGVRRSRPRQIARLSERNLATVHFQALQPSHAAGREAAETITPDGTTIPANRATHQPTAPIRPARKQQVPAHAISNVTMKSTTLDATDTGKKHKASGASKGNPTNDDPAVGLLKRLGY